MNIKKENYYYFIASRPICFFTLLTKKSGNSYSQNSETKKMHFICTNNDDVLQIIITEYSICTQIDLF